MSVKARRIGSSAFKKGTLPSLGHYETIVSLRLKVVP